MSARYCDFQDASNPLNGSTIDADQLGIIFDQAETRDSFAFELVAENGCSLIVGIAPTVGSLQHTPADGNPPYRVAITPTIVIESEEFEFLCGGTLSPFPARNVLPIEIIREIVREFVLTGEASNAVQWEEV